MTNNILIQKLRFVNLRIDTLKERFIAIQDRNDIPNYSGFTPGMYASGYSYNIFYNWDDLRMDFFRDWLARKFDYTTSMYNIEYHLQNIECVIAQYYHNLIWNKHSITPNEEVIASHICELEITECAIRAIIEKLELETENIDAGESVPMSCIDNSISK